MGPGTLKSTNYTMGAVLEQQKIMNCASWPNQQTQKIESEQVQKYIKEIVEKTPQHHFASKMTI
jgi:hypothetical protein